MVPELPKSGANGATRWLTDSKALIQMSIRNKWADIFWFTFFHEACHLLKHRTQRRMVIHGLDADPDVAALEAEANRFAGDFLIDPREWSDFCDGGYFTADSVKEFARSAGVAPFIVVGRLQKEKSSSLQPTNRPQATVRMGDQLESLRGAPTSAVRSRESDGRRLHHPEALGVRLFGGVDGQAAGVQRALDGPHEESPVRGR